MTIMKKLILTGVAFATFLILPASAQLSGAAGVDLASAYVYRGATVHDEIAIQPWAEVGLSGWLDGVTFGTWGDFNTDTTEFDEIDYSLGYNFDTGSDVDLGLTYVEYTYPTGNDGDGNSLGGDREIQLSTGTNIAGLDVGLLAAIGIEGPFLEDGIHVAANTEWTQSIPGTDYDFAAGATIGSEWGDNFDEEGISFAQLDASIAAFGGTLGAHYVIETDDDIIQVDEDFYVTLGYEF